MFFPQFSNRHLFIRKLGLSLDRILCLGPSSFGKGRRLLSPRAPGWRKSHVGAFLSHKTAFVNDTGHYAPPV